MARVVFLALVCGVMSISTLEWNTSTGTQRSKRQNAVGGVCVIPEPLQHGKYKPSYRRCPPENQSPACQLLPGAYVPSEWILHFTCDDGYMLNQNLTVAACVKGEWYPALPVCNRANLCPPLRGFGVDIMCTSGGHNVSCTQQAVPGTVATLKCKEGYQIPYQSEPSQLTCLASGAWDYPPFYCTQVVTLEHQGGSLTTLKPQVDKTTIRPKPHSDVRISTLKCQEYARDVLVIESSGFTEVDSCAMTESSITHEMDARPREYPHMALIGYKSGGKIQWVYVGSLISDRFILSSADCALVVAKGGVVKLGDYDVSSKTDDDNNDARTEYYDILETIINPDYSADPSQYNDIGLLKLKENVKFNEYVRPICLQTEHASVNTYAISTGWYYTPEQTSTILKERNFTIISKIECTDKDSGLTKANSSKWLCVKTDQKGAGECAISWAFGAPLQTRLQKPYCMYSLVGIISGGLLCDYPITIPGISHYVPWIEKIVWP